MYDEETTTWIVHKQIPATADKNVFINRADSGCISSRAGTVYSVGEEIIALDWLSLTMSVVTKLRKSAVAEGCVAISLSLQDDNFGFFFLSGDFYSITHSSWSSFTKPEPAFNIFSLNNQPVILGFASLQSDCNGESEDCSGGSRMLYGDNRVVQHNLETDTWDQIGYLGGTQNNFKTTTTAFNLNNSTSARHPSHCKLESFNFLHFVCQNTLGWATALLWRSPSVSATE